MKQQLMPKLLTAYLLDNGKAYTGAHVAGLLEYVLEETYFPSQYRAYKHFGGTMLIGEYSLVFSLFRYPTEPSPRPSGLALVAAGQVLRSFAMISASSNFSHL